MKPRTTVLLGLLWLLSLLSIPVYADTDGSELQILEPSNLEIQLGSEWAGTEFQLRTDMGIYPDSIQVDEYGILRLEIGGSKNYLLSSMSDHNSEVSYPAEDWADFSPVPDSSIGSNPSKAKPLTPFASVILTFGIGLVAGLCISSAIRRAGK